MTDAPSVPDGWQLVPVEPTPEMAEAFMKNLKEPYHPSGEAKYRPLHTWKAMLAAAPNPDAARAAANKHTTTKGNQ